MKKDEMIKMLKLDDEGKYHTPMKETTYEKSDNGYVIGIDLRNHSHLVQIGNLVLKRTLRTLWGMLTVWFIIGENKNWYNMNWEDYFLNIGTS